jgi:hypothetical protein
LRHPGKDEERKLFRSLKDDVSLERPRSSQPLPPPPMAAAPENSEVFLISII